jgi:hypothetical protein
MLMSYRAVALMVSISALVCLGAAHADPSQVVRVSPDLLQWFESTEQAMMTAVGTGDKAVWDRILDPSCVITSEEGQVLGKQQLLDSLRPLPHGLTGAITVRDLTVQALPGLAVVRYRAEELESVFGQALNTSYRITNTYQRVGAEWRMVASHTSVVTEDPPPQAVSTAGWSAFAGKYRLLPDGWTFTVELRNGNLYGGRDPKNLRRMIPLTPDAFVVSGTLGEWLFVMENGKAVRIVNVRKFQPLIWSRVED